MLMLYLLSIVLEFLIYIPPVWRIRKLFAPLIMIFIVILSLFLTFRYHNLLAFASLLIALFRLLNLLRIIKGRMNEGYLRQVARRTSEWLVLYQLILVSVIVLAFKLYTIQSLWLIYAYSLFIASLTVLVMTLINIHKTKHISVSEDFADRDLPTVTVAIPARNETQDLEDCIRTILANNYPKLEVIVLDDCSADRTPEIIRGFAHDGVRFVPGSEPESRWLAKNQAYEKLYEEASGELILFCGVDVRFGPDAIRSLVTTLLKRNKDMVSVMPHRISGDALATFIQPMRYWWELALPRRLFNRPPVLSTCWLIRRKTLKKLGGFAAVCHSIIPEGFFARELVKTDGYSFVRSDDLLDIQTRKSLSDQRETAIRTHYPQLRRRLEWVLLMSLINLFGLIFPFILVISTFWTGLDIFHWLAIASCAALIFTHISIVQISNPANILMAVISLPVAAITEFILGYASMLQYEFSTVEWKGRNICIPVMHVVPHLPKA